MRSFSMAGAAWRYIVLLTAVAVSGAVFVPTAADARDPGRYCLHQWPNDHDSFLLCQHLQNRNHLSFRRFLSDHGLSEKAIEQGRQTDNPTARAAAYCLKHWSPDYQGIWQCTQRRTGAGE